jgi:hypothetical protein
MKTIEVIGFFNEFNEGAIASIISKRLDYED